MTDIVKQLQALSDNETIPVSRGELVQLVARTFRAEGMNVAQAELHARMQVDFHFHKIKAALAEINQTSL